MKIGKIVHQIVIFDVDDFINGMKRHKPACNALFTYEAFPSAKTLALKIHQGLGPDGLFLKNL